jgi:hypothetical protein
MLARRGLVLFIVERRSVRMGVVLMRVTVVVCFERVVKHDVRHGNDVERQEPKGAR